MSAEGPRGIGTAIKIGGIPRSSSIVGSVRVEGMGRGSAPGLSISRIPGMSRSGPEVRTSPNILPGRTTMQLSRAGMEGIKFGSSFGREPIRKSDFKKPGVAGPRRSAAVYASAREFAGSRNNPTRERNGGERRVSPPRATSVRRFTPDASHLLLENGGSNRGRMRTDHVRQLLASEPYTPPARPVSVDRFFVRDRAPINSTRTAPAATAERPGNRFLRQALVETAAAEKRKHDVRQEIARIKAQHAELTRPVKTGEPAVANRSSRELPSVGQDIISKRTAVTAPDRNTVQTSVPQAETSGAAFGGLFRKRMVEVLKARKAKDAMVKKAEEKQPSTTAEAKAKPLKIWFYNSDDNAPAHDQLVEISDQGFISAFKAHLNVRTNSSMWRAMDALRASVTNGGRLIRLDITNLLKRQKEEQPEVKPALQMVRRTAAASSPAAAPTPEMTSSSIDAAASPAPVSAAAATGERSAVPVGAGASTEDVSIMPRGRQERNAGEEETTKGFPPRKQEEPEYGVDPFAQGVRAEEMRRAAINAPKDEDGNVKGTDVVAGTGKQSEAVLSGILKLLGGKVDGSWEASKAYIAGVNKASVSEILAAAKAARTMFPAVLKGKGQYVDEQQVQLVLGGQKAEPKDA